MGYLKFISYVYLAAAAFFIYDAIMRMQEGENPFLVFVLAFIALFMFFFRMNFFKKYNRRDRDN